MFGLVGSLVRWSPVLVVAGVAAVWCAAWKAQPASDSRAATAWQADSRALIERLRSDNPQAAANLEALQKRHPGPGFAAVLNDAYHRNDSAGLAEVARGRKNELLQLLDLAEEQAFTTPAAREQFLVAHGAYHQMLLAAGLRDEAARYLALLKKHQTPLDREAVRDDAVAVLVWDAVSDPDVRAFYLREREWLAPLLAELRLTAIETPGLCGPNGSPDLATVLTAAAAHHPLPKQAAVELQLGSSALQLFVDQGDAIAAAVDRHKLPLDAVLEVVFANSDWLAQRRAEGRTGAEIAHRLAGVAKARPALWAIARRYPFSLRLNEDAPRYAETVLHHFGSDGAAELLYSNYEKEVAPAAAAIALYGEAGFSVLVRYAGDARVQSLLAREDVGPRTVPFLAKFGDEGLDRIESNVAWLNRYFDENGTEKATQWWAAMPLVGAPAQVATNIVNGHPSEWSELGWAALDVADSALLVMSFGTSTVATGAAKETAKQSAKISAQRAGRLAAQQSLRGSRQAAKVVGASLLRRFVTMVATSSVGVGVRQAAKVVSAPIRYLFAGVKRAFDAWKLVPAVQKQLIYRGLFALGLTITLVNRTFPMAREAIGEGLQKVQKWATDARDLIVTQPLKELNKLLGLPAHSPGAWTLDLMFGAGLVALLYLLYRTACWTQPWRRRSLSYV